MFSSAVPYRNQHYSELRKDCVNSKSLFEDAEFPANDSSLYFRRSPLLLLERKCTFTTDRT
uniref:Uncharacterized protein n=1 Tax=Gouania willdenowi TaxID=441366 RepID=A0A8C5D8F6_GOUWI